MATNNTNLRMEASIKDIVYDATHYNEWCNVIINYLYTTRGLWFHVSESLIVDENGKRLFQSDSPTACLEWALKQPAIKASNNG